MQDPHQKIWFFHADEICYGPMARDYDMILVGAGLAGATAAAWLSETYRVLVMETHAESAREASGVSAGLINPLMARKARPVWRLPEALTALYETLARLKTPNLFQRCGVLRPAQDDVQAAFFQQAAEKYSDQAIWYSAEETNARHPFIMAPHGALWIHTGGALQTRAFVECLLNDAQARGTIIRFNTRVTSWGETNQEAFVETESGERITAATVILTAGYGLLNHPACPPLNLHAIKGQTIRISRPAGMDNLPCISGQGYIVPQENACIVGSTYEHNFTTHDSSKTQTQILLKKASQMMPMLGASDVLDAQAGVRITVPRTRLPMVGPISAHGRIWVWTGLGSKGGLMAPLVARSLGQYLQDPEQIPPEIRVQYR